MEGLKMASLDLDVVKGEFLLLEDFVDELQGVIVQQFYNRNQPGISSKIPILVADTTKDVLYSIVCIKITLKDKSTFTYIPSQTLIPNTYRRLFIHKLGLIKEKNLRDDGGHVLIPGWCGIFPGRNI